MPKITMICRNLEESLTDKIQLYGSLNFCNWFSFESAISALRKIRDTDLLITGLPPSNNSYDRSCLLIKELFYDLQIPIIIYTTADMKDFKSLWSTPVFIIPREGIDNGETNLLKIIKGISNTWFPLDLEGRKQFMTTLCADYTNTGSGFPMASDTILYQRFGVMTLEEVQENLNILNQSQKKKINFCILKRHQSIYPQGYSF